MREIKFRAWWVNKEYLPEGMMFRVGGLSFTTPQEGEPESDYRGKPVEVGLMRYDSDKIGWNKADECTLMQFTGLKDKNGKEIYEGDLIQCTYCKAECGQVVWNTGMHRFQLDWSDTVCANARLTSIDHRANVIGNIYEHPELLK